MIDKSFSYKTIQKLLRVFFSRKKTMTINKFGSSLNHDTRVSTKPSRCIDQCLKSEHADQLRNKLLNEITTVVEKKLNEGVDIPRFQTDIVNKKYVDDQLEVTEALSRQLIISKFNELSTEQNIKLNEIEKSSLNKAAIETIRTKFSN